MMFGLGSFNLINEFERASNEPNAEQLASSLAWLQPYVWVVAQSARHASLTDGI